MKVLARLFSLVLMVCGAAVAHGSSITFLPVSQTINLGASAIVDVQVSGLTRGQALGAFDLIVLSNASILQPTSVQFLTSLGDPSSQLTSSLLTGGSASAAEVSFESSSTLLGLQANQPFSLFQITYLGIGAGTSSLTLGTPLVLSDGSGNVLAAPTVTAGSITVVGGNPPTPPTVPEPSTLLLLSTGSGALAAFARRSRLAVLTRVRA